MERKLQQRMVGAGVLILALVILGPMVLDGGSGTPVEEEAVPGQRTDELRTHTFRLDPAATDKANAPAPPSAGPPPAAASAGEARPLPAPVVAPPPETTAAPAAAVSVGAVAKRTAEPTADPGRAAPPAVASTAAPPPAVPQSTAQPGAATGGGWLVQVGTFGQQDNSERLVKTLTGRGFAAFASPTTRGGKTLYRVRVGPAGSREAAAAMADRLAAAGQSGQVVAQ
jgi:DedD protein